MPKKVLKVSRRYMLSFLSYREKTGGGNISPPPALRGLKTELIGFQQKVENERVYQTAISDFQHLNTP